MSSVLYSIQGINSYYSPQNNFLYRWQTKDTVRFLRLWKKYPVLHLKYVPKPDALHERNRNYRELMKECSKASLGLRDVEALRSKCAILRGTFMGVLANFKKNIKKHPNKWPHVTLPWFEEAIFIDTSGFVQRMKDKLLPPTKTRTAAKTAAVPKPKPVVRRAVPQPMIELSRRQHNTRSNATDQEESLKEEVDDSEGIFREIKIEVDENYDGEEFDEEEDEYDEEGLESGEIVESSGDKEQEESEVPSVNHQQQSQPNSRRELPLAAPFPPHQATRIDHFHAFLQYTKLRTENYMPHQKRELVNTLMSVMTKIDEENEAMAAQDYSIQVYPPPVNECKE